MTETTGTVKFRKYKMKRANTKYDGKIYARALHDRTLEFEELVSHIAAHNTAYSRGVIHGVLIDTLDCLKELILDGKSVRLGDLGLFNIGLDTTPADTLADFTASKNIEGVHLNVLNTKAWSNKELKGRIRFEEDDEYQIEDSDGEA